MAGLRKIFRTLKGAQKEPRWPRFIRSVPKTGPWMRPNGQIECPIHGQGAGVIFTSGLVTKPPQTPEVPRGSGCGRAPPSLRHYPDERHQPPTGTDLQKKMDTTVAQQDQRKVTRNI